MGITTKEDRAQAIREELEELKERYEEDCAYLWRTKYEYDYSCLEQKLDDVLGII